MPSPCRTCLLRSHARFKTARGASDALDFERAEIATGIRRFEKLGQETFKFDGSLLDRTMGWKVFGEKRRGN